MAGLPQDRGLRFEQTASGTATASLTVASQADVIPFVTDISASTSASPGTCFLYSSVSPGSGSTTLWSVILGSVPYEHSFAEPLAGMNGGSLTLTANGTTTTYVNISGFYINVK